MNLSGRPLRYLQKAKIEMAPPEPQDFPMPVATITRAQRDDADGDDKQKQLAMEVVVTKLAQKRQHSNNTNPEATRQSNKATTRGKVANQQSNIPRQNKSSKANTTIHRQSGKAAKQNQQAK